VTDLKERGVAFRSLTEQIDTTTPQGELLFHIFGALAQFERALIQERVQAGLAAARRRGRRGGRPVAIDAEKLGAVIAARSGRQQGSGLPYFRRPAQHADRLAGPHRLVCRPQRGWRDK
jgi:DNA invertase Pin-like site-specific DNA recombinase